MTKKKVIVIGATGTIGQGVVNNLEADCEVIRVGNTSGDFQVDIADSASIQALYEQHADADAVVCTAARGVKFDAVSELTKADYNDGAQSKLYGQIDLVLQGLHHLNKKDAVFVLTTGILNIDPIPTASVAAMVNGGVEAFVKAAAMTMPEKKRVNVVSPGLLLESVEKYKGFFHGYQPVPAATVALAYRKAIFGAQNGEVLRVG